MNIIEENEESVNNASSARTMKILVVLMVITVLISIGIIGAIYYLKETDFEFSLDGKVTKSYSKDLFVFEDNKVYISIKDMARMANYVPYNGAYGSKAQYSEDITKCYIESENEIASFELNSNTIYKVDVKTKLNYEYFEIDEPVIQINNNLYTTVDGISKACNLKFNYNKQKNKIEVYTLDYLVDYYKKSNPKVDVYNFNNQKAILYNMLIVSNVEQSANMVNIDAKYGVYSLDGKEIIGIKYKKIEFIENNKDFLVMTTDYDQGILSSEGITKIQPEYDELKLIDKDLKLYLATYNGKQGIIKENGQRILYLEYDKVGINSKNYPADEIKNQYILYNNAIPVYQNKKWGLYNKNGKLIVPIEYDSMGCLVKENDEGEKLNAESVLLIPEIKGIVVCKKNAKGNYKFGVVNYKGDTIIPNLLDIVYSITNEGKKEYYMENGGNTINLLEWVNENVEIDELNLEN